MARKQLGAAPSASTDTATKGYVDAEISAIELTPGASGASGVPGATGPVGATGPTGASGASGGTGGTGAQGASGVPGSNANVTSESVTSALGYTPESVANKAAANGYASLDANGRIPVTQLPNSVMEYQGTWNPSTNSPSLADGTGSAGDVYRVSAAGSRNLGSGSITFDVGDYVIYNGSVWQKADTTDAVSTVAGRTGDVVLTKSDVGLGNVDNTADANKDVLSASKLTTARTINGVSFDGSANITVPAGITRSVTTITSNTTLGSAANTDYVGIVTAAATVTLPSATTVGSNSYTVKNATATAISINPNGFTSFTGDPNWASVSILLLGNGPNNGTTLTDSSANNFSMTRNGSVVTSTAQKKYGTASIYFPGLSSYLYPPSSSQFTFGTGDFTVEHFVRFDATAAQQGIWQISPSSLFNGTSSPALQLRDGKFDLYIAGSANITTGFTASANTWYHCAWVRSSGTSKFYVDGTSVYSTADTTNYTGTFLGLGSIFSTGINLVGYLDDFRITRAARYLANFTPPTAEAGVGASTADGQSIDGINGPLSVSASAVTRLISDGSGWRTV